jgi:hypothetical protein
MKTHLTPTNVTESILRFRDTPPPSDMGAIEGVITLLEIMQIYIDKILWIAHKLSTLKTDGVMEAKTLPVGTRVSCVGLFDAMHEMCKELELETTAVLIKRLADDFRAHEDRTWGHVGEGVTFVENAMSAEMSTMVYVRIARARREQYEQKTPLFGADVRDAFPSAAHDISEAGKCLAFGRGTATVFHLVRGVEFALQALVRAQNAVMPIGTSRTWGTMLRAIQDTLPTPPNPPNVFAQEAMAHMRTIKNAWRDQTMHTESVYTEQEAQTIFDAVGALMRHLATQLHE